MKYRVLFLNDRWGRENYRIEGKAGWWPFWRRIGPTFRYLADTAEYIEACEDVRQRAACQRNAAAAGFHHH